MADDPWSGLDRQAERWTVLSWGDNLTDHQEDSKLIAPRKELCCQGPCLAASIRDDFSQVCAARQGFCYLTVT